jgi:hypothetical protein
MHIGLVTRGKLARTFMFESDHECHKTTMQLNVTRWARMSPLGLPPSAMAGPCFTVRVLKFARRCDGFLKGPERGAKESFSTHGTGDR